MRRAQTFSGEFPDFLGQSVYNKGSPQKTIEICKFLRILFQNNTVGLGLIWALGDGFQVKHRRLGVRQRNGVSVRRGVGGRGEECELAPCGNSRPCGRERGMDVVYCTHGDGVELAVCGHGFNAVGPDFGAEVEGADDFAEKGGFFVLGLGEGHLNVWAKQGYRETWKAGSGAEVEEGRGVEVEVTAGEEALSEVAADDLFGAADGGEVGAGVPFEEEVEVDGELGGEEGWHLG